MNFSFLFLHNVVYLQSMEIMDEIIEHQKTNSGAYISTIERSFVLPEVRLLVSYKGVVPLIVSYKGVFPLIVS